MIPSKGKSRVFVREAAYDIPLPLIEEMLDAVAPPLEGRRVLVKPNCLAGTPPERGVTTHPSLVAGLVAALRRRGARVQVGDNPGARSYGKGRDCFRLSGLLAAAGDAFVDAGQETRSVAVGSAFAECLVVSRAVLDADVVVSVPKLKTHCLTLLTGAVKNMYGILAGGEKARLHYAAKTRLKFSDALVDVYGIRPPDFAFMDAVEAMEGDGPSNGRVRHVGKVIAGADPLAVDAVAARLMGVESRAVDHLRLAAARGFGVIDPGRIEIDGDAEPVRGFRLPSTARLGIMSAVANLLVFNLLHRSRLRVDRRACEGCGECVAACPSGAMTMNGDECVIDEEKCHQCFCCQELCPTGAVTVSGALGALLRRGERKG